MTPERWQQVKQLFAEAQRREGEERSSYLEAACGSDRSLFDEVASLLSAQTDPVATEALRPPFATGSSASTAFPDQTQSRRGMDGPLRFNERIGAASPGADIAIGRRIGRYRITGLLGRGGMGAVYEADQDEPRRTVALKVVRGGTFVDEHVARLFRREAQALAMLNHPNIATLYEVGHTEEGEHYFVMERVHGIPLDQYVREARPPIRECMALYAQICEAIAYAHQRGIIHRDLKPGNILVVEEGTEALRHEGTEGAAHAAPQASSIRPQVHPKILDFGLAKITESDVSVSTMTAGMQRIEGTLAYMSPEQTRGRLEEIDVRSDIYSLGVLMYELLAGRPPYNVRSIPLPMAIRAICEEEPTTPSSAVAGVSRLALDGAKLGQGTDAEAVRPWSSARQLQGDIDTIVLKCLQKDPVRRYQGAADLAQDIRHYLAGEPIEARRDSFSYVLRKNLWRYRFPVGVAAGFVLLLTAGLITTLTLYGQAVRQRDRAVSAESREREQRQLAEEQEKLAKQEASRADAESVTAKKQASIAESANRFLNDMLAKANRGEQKGNPNVTVREVLDAASQELKPSDSSYAPEVEASLRTTMGKTYVALGLYDTAESQLRESVRLCRKLYGNDAPEIAESLDQLADLLQIKGDYEEAEPLRREVLALFRRLVGDDHLSVAGGLNNLAALLWAKGDFENAEPLYQQALATRRKFLGDNHPKVASTMNNLAALLASKGDYSAAESLYRQSTSMMRRSLGDDHPDVAPTMNNLAVLLRKEGKLTESESVYRESLAMRSRLLGEEHPEVARGLHNLALVLLDQRKNPEAEGMIRKALRINRKSHGNEHPDVAKNLNALAGVLQASGDYSAAEKTLREALDLRRKMLGGDHPDVANILNNLGGLLKEIGDFSAAEPLFRDAMAINAKTLGQKHPNTAIAMVNLAQSLQEQDRYGEAEPLLREALEIYDQKLPSGHRLAITARFSLGQTLRDLGQFAEAEDLMREAIALQSNDSSASTKENRTMLLAMIRLHESWDTAEPGHGHDTKATEWRAKLAAWQATTQPASVRSRP